MTDNQKFEPALRNVINELKAPKNQKNTFGGYNFRSAEDILEAVKPLLHQQGLRMKLSDRIVQSGNRYYVEATVTVKGHGEEDSASALAREAEAKKGMDEAQITGAASSYARKYALNGMFDIDDTKDADTQDNRDEPAVKPVSDSQRNLIRKLAREIGTTDETIETRLTQIKTSAQANEAIQKLKGDL